MRALFGLTPKELKPIVESLSMKGFAAEQLARWMYARRAQSFGEMTDLPLAARRRLSEEYSLDFGLPAKRSASADGTVKYLFRAGDSKRAAEPSEPSAARPPRFVEAPPRFVEAAYIPTDDRKTLCVSTQAGCRMGCLFCMTGKQGLQGHLSASEILSQVRGIPESAALTNVVYMGMGEPLDNLENVLRSLEILTSDWGFGFSSQRVTLSSVGLLPALEEFFRRSKVRFALSLHSPFEEERRSLMPVQNVHALSQVLAFLKEAQRTDARRITIEYILFEGVNDSPRHRRELVRILRGLKTRVNLIHYHAIPGSPLRGSSDRVLAEFQEALVSNGISASVRRSRGEDIQAACGLLSTKEYLKPMEAEPADF
jgi:23S rRNA (adenine2503-C2)-methyltransferase